MSVITRVYFSQTFVIFFSWDLAAVCIIRVSVIAGDCKVRVHFTTLAVYFQAVLYLEPTEMQKANLECLDFIISEI